jgi:hypothetical protein
MFGWSASNAAYHLGHTFSDHTQPTHPCLGMLRTHGHRLCHLFVNDDINPDALFSLALQQPVEAPFFILSWGSAKVQLWSEPPIQDEDRVLGAVQYLRHSPHIILAINMPLDRVLLPLTRKALKSMTGIDFCPNFVVEFLFRGIVATCTCAMQHQIVVRSKSRKANDYRGLDSRSGSKKPGGSQGVDAIREGWHCARVLHTDYLIAGAFDAFGEPSGVVEDFV